MNQNIARQARRYYISGRVQGVFFRQSTVDEAIRLGLRGYARNLPDGRVEVVASGESVALDQFLGWLHQGPPEAEVTQIEQGTVDVSLPDGFEVRY